MKTKKMITKGFTLAELLVVVAIIAILVAVSIPIFASKTEETREKTCEANRRSAKALLSNAYMTGEGMPSETAALCNQSSFPAYKDIVCPSDGVIKYTITDGVIEVTCSKHTIKHSFGNKEDLDKIFEIFSQSESGGTLDSTAPEGAFVHDDLKKLLDTYGIDLKAMGATSWGYQSGQGFYFTTSDVTKDNKYVVIKYNLKPGDYYGFYSIWEGKPATKTLNGDTYNVVSASTTELSKNIDSKDKQNYDVIKKLYDEIVSQR